MFVMDFCSTFTKGTEVFHSYARQFTPVLLFFILRKIFLIILSFLHLKTLLLAISTTVMGRTA